MSVRAIVALGVVLVLAACSSGGTGESAPSDGSAPAPTTVAVGDDGPYYAIVTIGDVRYEFDMDVGNNGCGRPADGIFTGAGYTDDANPAGSMSEERTSGARLQFSLKTDDLDGSQVVVEDFASGAEWWSGLNRPQELGPDEAVIEDWTTSDITAAGSASFIDTEAFRLARSEGGSTDPVPGTFEFHCAER